MVVSKLHCAEKSCGSFLGCVKIRVPIERLRNLHLASQEVLMWVGVCRELCDS